MSELEQAHKDEVQILELSLKVISQEFNDFIASCLDEQGKPQCPNMKSIMKARGFLPPTCSLAFKKKDT